jgi:hypothetical protein
MKSACRAMDNWLREISTSHTLLPQPFDFRHVSLLNFQIFGLA